MSDLKTLAEAAKDGEHNKGIAWYSTNELMFSYINYPTNARFIAAASPDAILKLLEDRDRLREALKEATQSLETIASLAGRKTYGLPPIETFMSHFDEVRGYAASRAGVGRQALEEAR